MMFCGSFCQVLICVLAKFRSPPNPLIAGVQHLNPLTRGCDKTMLERFSKH
jgi:hypothetical protein